MKLLLDRPRLALTMWLGCWCLALVLTHMPLPHAGPATPPYFDKVAHFLMYFAITFLGATRSRAAGRETTLRFLVLWGVIYATYAAIDEWTQPWTHRTADVGDWLADLTGVVAASNIGFMWLRRARLSEPCQ